MDKSIEEKEILNMLVSDLISLGENAEELSMVVEMFDILDQNGKDKMIQNLIKEKEELEKLKK